MQLEDRLYSSSEVAKILGVSRRTLYRYLESGSLSSMQLPSGRHRFTKEQVEAFLVENYGSADSRDIGKSPLNITSNKVDNNMGVEKTEGKVAEEVKRPSVFSKVNKTPQFETDAEVNVTTPELETEEEEQKELLETPLNQVEEQAEVKKQDEVSSVAEEAEEAEEEEETEEAEEEETEEVDEVVEDLKKTLSSLFEDEDETEDEEEDEVAQKKEDKSDKNSFQYYSSSITDLKKLAKTIKVASENSNVQYAFTGQAGASLFGEVSPFGQLHLYIRKNDMLFFEKRFNLTEASEEDSNVALKIVDELPEHNIVMGFKVVSLPVLKKDLIQLGDTKTASNLEG